MKRLIAILLCFSLVACATPEQKEQNKYVRTIQKAQRAIEFGRSEIATGKATILRGENRVKENEEIIKNSQRSLNNLGYYDGVETVIVE